MFPISNEKFDYCRLSIETDRGSILLFLSGYSTGFQDICTSRYIDNISSIGLAFNKPLRNYCGRTRQMFCAAHDILCKNKKL